MTTVTSPLYRAMYWSQRCTTTTQFDLDEILNASLRHNSRNQVTGLLAHTKEYFVQLLEGPYHVLDHLLAGIRRDPRHRYMTLTQFLPIEQRNFPHWIMGEARLPDYILAQVQCTDRPFHPGKLTNAELLEMMEMLGDMLMETICPT